MANELLPCPFCSGPAEIYNPFHMIGKPSQPATYRGGVRCRACGCESKATTPPDGAITTWNRRANAAPQASTVAGEAVEDQGENKRYYNRGYSAAMRRFQRELTHIKDEYGRAVLKAVDRLIEEQKRIADAVPQSEQGERDA